VAVATTGMDKVLSTDETVSTPPAVVVVVAGGGGGDGIVSAA